MCSVFLNLELLHTDAQAQPGEDVEDAPASDGEEDSAADPEESDEDTH